MPGSDIITHAPNLTELLSSGIQRRASARSMFDRSQGALFGLAVGNLLGLPVEGAWYDDIDTWYPNGVKSIDPREAFRSMDDDLAQAVDLGEALVSADDYVSEFASRLVTWFYENGRGCGSTTRAVIRLLDDGVPHPEAARIIYEERNRIAPNGGVMRCAPVAVARLNSPEQLISDSAATCAVTHYAPTCQWSCIIVNAAIALLVRGENVDLGSLIAAAQADGAPDLAAVAHSDGIPSDMLDAISNGGAPPDDTSWLRRDQVLIGHTLLAMQVGLWAVTTPLSLVDALSATVMVGGDTDTNAAVAGAVLGARDGASAIPSEWLDCVPERSRIETLADNLTALGRNPIG